MKLWSSALVVAVLAQGTFASWLSRAAYNSWQKTELERWLDDNDIPYPSAAERKDLEKIVQENWDTKVSTPYTGWDIKQLQAYLADRGYDAKEGAKEGAERVKESAEQSKDGLIAKVKSYWHETEDQAQEAYLSVKDWIFDSWNDSQIVAYLEKHGVPVPHPPKRENLVAAARNNYDAAAKKAGEGVSYPGNWLYASWSDSDLKAWLDTHGVPVPQPSSRDRLIASVRRNARLASKKSKGTASSVSSAASSATGQVSEAIFDTWSDSRIKEWADSKGIKVPQGSTRNELLALARKHKASLSVEDVGSSAASAFGAATSKVGEQAARATDAVKQSVDDVFNGAISTWSDSRLKAFLDARGVPVPQAGKRDELVAAVRRNRHKTANSYSSWTFETWNTDDLKAWLDQHGGKQSRSAGRKADATREELIKQAQEAYASASHTGGKGYASVTSALAAATGYVKDTTFDTWTSSDLKAYLDSYGIPVPQGSTTEELKALARRQSTYFRYGTSSPSGTMYAKVQNGFQWLLDQLKWGAASGRNAAEYQGQRAYDRVKEEGTKATHRAGEAAQQAKDRVKEEL